MRIIVASCMLMTLISHGAEEDFYKGRFCSDADYILSGGLIKDLPEPIKVPVDYVGEGFAAGRMSKVPEAGVHPRVIMSPEDVERMKKMVTMGDEAPRFFRIHMEALRRNKEWEVPQNYAYYASPFGDEGEISKWALLALLTDDRELGQRAAKAAVDHALYLEPRVDILNSHDLAKHFKDSSYDFVRANLKFGPFSYDDAYYSGGRKNIERLTKKHGVEIVRRGDPAGSYLTLGWEYDYAYNFMTDEQRDIVRRVISKITYGKYDTGMSIPGQMYINNHMSAVANWIPLALAIEGEEGYDERILPIATWSLHNKLSYDLSSDGITYENTKGFIPMLAVLSCARRQGSEHPQQLLKHSHLVARAYSNVQHARKLHNRYIWRHRHREGTKPLHEIKDGQAEPRFWRASGGSGSGGQPVFWFVLKYFYPDNPLVDFVYNIKNSDYNAEIYEGKPSEQYRGRLHYSWFDMPALSMMAVSEDTDYNKQDTLDQFKDLPGFWFDSERGMVSMRNGWDKDSMLVHMENRTDQYYAGHETPQHGDFQVWADGISWSPNLGAYRDASYRAIVTVDGKAGIYSPISGDWMDAWNTDIAATSVAEMTTAYRWRKVEKLLHLDHPALEQVPHVLEIYSQAAYNLSRYSELPYLKKTKDHYNGYAHLDYGPWHGETRGCERYEKWNDPMNFVFRTIHFARGEKPYLLVMDDLEKDGENHQFDWRMPVAGDSIVYSLNPAPLNRHLENNTEGAIGTDIIFAMAGTEMCRGYAPVWGGVYPKLEYKPKIGDPMLLVRVLWRNTNFPFPVPNVQRYWEYNMVSVPAFGVNPEYKVLIFPYRFGDKLPTTHWSDDRGQLIVQIGENVDVYDFDKTDRHRTVFSMRRNGKKVTDSRALPAKPLLVENGKWTVDQNRPEWRQPRIFTDKSMVCFKASAPGAVIYYTTDGSEPDESSAVYEGGVELLDSCTLKARTYQADWRCGTSAWSDSTAFEFVKCKKKASVSVASSVSGLTVKGYEIKTTLYDKKGFFHGSKLSLPNIKEYTPLVTSIVENFEIPKMQGKMTNTKMPKAFYEFAGYFEAPKDGVYYFEVESCGPVDFKIGGQEVILVNQQYGLSYKKRYGEIALAKGKHPLYLLVCDTMYWKGDIEKHYEISVAVKGPGEEGYAAVASHALSCNVPFAVTGKTESVGQVSVGIQPVDESLVFKYSVTKLVKGDEQPKPLKPLKNEQRSFCLKDAGRYLVSIAAYKDGLQIGNVVQKNYTVLKKHQCVEADVLPGVIVSKYDRVALSPKRIAADGLPLEYFDISAIEPYSQSYAERMVSNSSTRKLVEYSGMIRISRDGLCEFKLHQSKENSGQLMVNGEVVARQRVAAPAVVGKIWLSRGLHPFTLQVAQGSSVVYMKHSDDMAFKALTVAALARPAVPQIHVNGALEDSVKCEIFGAVSVELSSPVTGAEIMYSVDGSKPSKTYTGAIHVDETTTLKTVLVVNGRSFGEERMLSITKSIVPQNGLIVYLDCEKIESNMTPVQNGNGAQAVVVEGVIVPGKNGNAIGLYEEASVISLRKMQTHEDESTVACWVNLKEFGDIGVLASVPYVAENYDFRLRDNWLYAEWKRNIGAVGVTVSKDELEPGTWFHIAASFGNENAVYLNGEMVGRVQCQNMSSRRGSGLADGVEAMYVHGKITNAAVDEYRIYDRVLSPAEIKVLYDAGK